MDEVAIHLHLLDILAAKHFDTRSRHTVVECRDQQDSLASWPTPPSNYNGMPRQGMIGYRRTFKKSGLIRWASRNEMPVRRLRASIDISTDSRVPRSSARTAPVTRANVPWPVRSRRTETASVVWSGSMAYVGILYPFLLRIANFPMTRPGTGARRQVVTRRLARGLRQCARFPTSRTVYTLASHFEASH